MHDVSTPAPGPAPATAILVGFQEHDNLGIGYLAATLRRAGHRVVVFDFEADPRAILAAALELRPDLVGFSLIFQFHLDRFRGLMTFLRAGGVRCHFTIGGHFPSLSYGDTLRLIPELDSVVRFEGEHTLLELLEVVAARGDWRAIHGIAWWGADGPVATPMRRLEDDLDRFPHPERLATPKRVLGQAIAPILASRGCARTCSFCSIHVFYRTAPGKIVRTRKPAEVVREMRMLHEERGVTVFLFQDDDFPLFGPAWRRWTEAFLSELHQSGLVGRVAWKINCRADVVETELFARMRAAGLYFVYMGLESGSEDGLDVLHKQITVDQNLRAVETLKALDIFWQYGFMLFDPTTDFASVRANLRFLERIVGDGSAGATFCRMIPYDGTPIKDRLQREGRLRGSVRDPDYDFLDPRVGRYYEELSALVNFAGWVHGHQALTPLLDYLWHEVAVMKRLAAPLPWLAAYEAALREVTATGNTLLFRVVEDVAALHEAGTPHTWTADRLREACEGLRQRVLDARTRFVVANEPMLVRAFAAGPTVGRQPPAARTASTTMVAISS